MYSKVLIKRALSKKKKTKQYKFFNIFKHEHQLQMLLDAKNLSRLEIKRGFRIEWHTQTYRGNAFIRKLSVLTHPLAPASCSPAIRICTTRNRVRKEIFQFEVISHLLVAQRYKRPSNRGCNSWIPNSCSLFLSLSLCGKLYYDN